MSEWIETTIGSVMTFQRGFDITRESQRVGIVPVVSSGGIRSYHDTAAARGPGVVIGRKGTLGGVFYLPGDYWPHDTTLWVKDFKGGFPRFVYYFMTQFRTAWLDVGSANPTLNRNHLHPLRILWPHDRGVQKAIAEVLGALDDKIAANTRTLSLISDRLSAQFDHVVAQDGRLLPLADAANFHNRRRIPLSANEREARPGSVPYYGASGAFGTVDRALFNEPLVLVGEDGSVINTDDTPVTQYIWGPAWVNNHAHVLTGSLTSTEVLYLAVRRANVATLVTGAVQPKISMGNLKRLLIELPPLEALPAIETMIGSQFELHRSLTTESTYLAATRDALLPALMSGKLRVRDAERIVEDAV